MEANEEHADKQEIKTRDIRDGPFCWQSKEVLKTIDNIFDASNDVCSTRSVYLALSEIASDEQAETFTRRIGEIARHASVSYSTTARILKRFETLKIIAVQRNFVEGTKELSASTYTLGNGYLTLSNDRIRPSFPRKNTLRVFIEKPGGRAATELSGSQDHRARKNNDHEEEAPPHPLASVHEGEEGEEGSAEPSADYWPQTYSKLSEAKKHPRWKSFATFCKKKKGEPCLKGFNTWSRDKPPVPLKRKTTTGKSAEYETLLRASEEKADRERKEEEEAERKRKEQAASDEDRQENRNCL